MWGAVARRSGRCSPLPVVGGRALATDADNLVRLQRGRPKLNEVGVEALFGELVVGGSVSPEGTGAYPVGPAGSGPSSP